MLKLLHPLVLCGVDLAMAKAYELQTDARTIDKNYFYGPASSSNARKYAG